MKNYQHWATETLQNKKKTLAMEVEQWERILETVNSFLIQYSLTHAVKKAKEEIHAIEAELVYREKTGQLAMEAENESESEPESEPEDEVEATTETESETAESSENSTEIPEQLEE